MYNIGLGTSSTLFIELFFSQMKFSIENLKRETWIYKPIYIKTNIMYIKYFIILYIFI